MTLSTSSGFVFASITAIFAFLEFQDDESMAKRSGKTSILAFRGKQQRDVQITKRKSFFLLPLLRPRYHRLTTFPRKPSATLLQEMAQLPSAAWIKSVDATYMLFESKEYREQYSALAEQVRNAVKLCEEVIREFG
jgi:hypothetical protein